MPSTEILIFAPIIVFLAYFVFGLCGFGSTLLAVPLLALLWPLKFVIPVVVSLDCISAIFMRHQLRDKVWKKELYRLLPFLMVGLGLGTFVLTHLSTHWLSLCLGLLITVFGSFYLINRHGLIHLPPWSCIPIGLFAGTTSSALGVGGPLYVFFFNGRGASAEQTRASVPAVFSFTTLARIVLFSLIGLFNLQVFFAILALLPIMAVAMVCGLRSHSRFNRVLVIRLVGLLIMVNGLALITRTIFQ
jgi:hypothetical protein